jgi:hypothetical protein
MAQVFKRRTNTYAKVSIFGGVFFIAGGLWGLAALNRSDYATRAHVARQQPIPFSHKHHAGELGIDCRYCHTSVEQSARASIPATQVCMNCHSQIWTDSPTLEPVRASFLSGKSIRWIKVHDLPDFVYFNHSAHVNKGVACVTCHGRIDRMNLVFKEHSLQMEWCIGCHRNPGPNLTPREHVFDMSWTPEGDRDALAKRLLDEYQVHTRTDCDTCHR